MSILRILFIYTNILYVIIYFICCVVSSCNVLKDAFILVSWKMFACLCRKNETFVDLKEKKGNESNFHNWQQMVKVNVVYIFISTWSANYNLEYMSACMYNISIRPTRVTVAH